jgi:hypothetical protein
MRRVLIAAAIVAALAAPLALTAPSQADTWDQVLAAREATAQFHKVSHAKKAGYAKLRDAEGIACIDSDSPAGAMGIHFVNGDLVSDDQVRARKP